MKKITRNICFALLLGSVGMSFQSCTNKLDILPEGAPSKASFWKTKEDAIKGANGLYYLYDEEDFYGRGFAWFLNASDDMVTGRNNAQAENIRTFNGNYIGGGYTESQWQMRYAIIKQANDILRYVPSISMDEALKKRILGEANFNAGYMYFQLAVNYADERAGVPIVTVENMDNEKATPRAANIEENYRHIEKLLKEAADQLPFFNELEEADYGRAHKVAAWAVLSKMYLYKKDYKNAILYADMVINQGKRGLAPTFKDVFKAANNWGPEYIWSVTSTAAGTDGWGSILPGVMLTNGAWGFYNGWGYYMPTKELYDSYEAGDERREATILKPGDKFVFFGKERIFEPASSATCDMQFNKYMEPFSHTDPVKTGHVSPNGNHMATDLNVPLIRFAEILLIKAEASIMLNGSGAGDKELNMIRKRANLLEKTGMTLTDLKRERRNELAGEFSDRHRDLVRWGDAEATYAKPLHTYAMKNGSGMPVEFAGRKFDPKTHHVWAVPRREVDNSAGLIKQNQGW
ncbi:RagB/SusD family nutrient uptake outer membrane protein [Sphingobacterium sp. ML3W]|uniref:RagB/SusD family nutrient uptake outer membrane protein n=1 Tax=Sphingobacterium sp. ML3W TaxID=1538644 RepID=UPI00249A8371|nr:RagB/SusD family nutrient uptake outer membrane protein [Sphingobacterium sp. ML3W]WFA77725.1 RagB/SusD family nutrient uptake outer membrane protein [Sphingobacterium sp. ML3W]